MGAESAELSVVYEDSTLLVLNKPSGLLSVPGRGDDKQDCLASRVQACYADASIVHRLDMATSGLMLMARGATAQRLLNDAFASRAVHKRYEAVVDGLLHPENLQDDGQWQEINLPIALDWPHRPLRIIDAQLGKPSQTRWQMVSHDPNSGTSRVRLEPLTGRSHQLRVHMKAIGHPIVGDTLYAPPHVQAKAPRLLLHATELGLVHPVTQQPMRWLSQAPF